MCTLPMKKGLFLSMLPIGVANNIAPILAKSVTELRDIYVVSGFPECHSHAISVLQKN